MKKNLTLTIAVMLFVATTACTQTSSSGAKKDFSKVTDTTVVSAADFSYAFGLNVADAVKKFGVEDFDKNEFINAFKARLDNVDTVAPMKVNLILNNFMRSHHMKKQEQEEAAEKAKHSGRIEEGQAFLEKNKNEDGVITAASGLQYKIIQQGTGAYPTAEDQVEVHYRGTLLDGTEFDSSYSRGETATFPLRGVIAGWTEGIQKINEGGKIRLFIPYQLAYGPREMSQHIKPYSTLIFDVELIKIVK